MAAPKIAAVATATPPWHYDQATGLRMSGYDDPRRMGFFNNSLIETRHLYLDPETFTPNEDVDQLNERWRRGAIEVGASAVARAIERAGWRREDVDFLATTTCTGRVCPSLDSQIINALGLKSTIQRVHVGDTGCASAMVAMQQVSNHLRAFPEHRAVMVAVEICSADRRRHDEGDGRRAAGLARAQEGGHRALRAALGGAAGDRAGGQADGAGREPARALAQRAAAIREHVLRHRGLRARRPAALARAGAGGLGPHDRARAGLRGRGRPAPLVACRSFRPWPAPRACSRSSTGRPSPSRIWRAA